MKVVCFSEIQWKYVRTRKQQILSRFPTDWSILFISTFVKGKKNNIFPEKDGNITHACVPVFKNFPQASLRSLFSFAPVRFLWNILLLLWINILFLITGFSGKDRVFYVSNIYYGAILRFLPGRMMLYDCNDDHLGFPNTPLWAEGYFDAIIRNADVVVAVSEELVEKLKGLGVEKVHHIGNGVDYEMFERAIAKGVPEEMTRFKRPIIGYSGAVAQWFDFELLEKVADRFPDTSIVIVGPLFGASLEQFSRIAVLKKNIFHIGSKPYEKLGSYIAAMDVCIIPLKANRLMRYADPNKIYEYAAAGRPIVTMKHTDKLGELEGLIYTASTHEEFLERIAYALDHGADEEALKKFASKKSWQARADAMKHLILDTVQGAG